jgi:hypothetical protein
MTASKSLPPRPSLESLRKQAKKLARDIAAGDASAIARARVHVPHADVPLTQRNAQLVIAREYGYAGWQALAAEVSKRLGKSLEWAVEQARRIIRLNQRHRSVRRCGRAWSSEALSVGFCWAESGVARKTAMIQVRARMTSGYRPGPDVSCLFLKK